jgi:hypothetical protein
LYRAKRREIGEQVGRLYLVEILRLPQALKPPGAKAPETDPVLRTRCRQALLAPSHQAVECQMIARTGGPRRPLRYGRILGM